jgi:hypothetical protein
MISARVCYLAVYRCHQVAQKKGPELLEYPYDIPAVNQMVTEGKSGAGRPIRGWHRQGRITGSKQKQKNSKIWLNPKGVLEAWLLWADHKGLDPEHDMPTAVRNVTQSLRPDSADEITVVAKPGTVIKVVCAA